MKNPLLLKRINLPQSMFLDKHHMFVVILIPTLSPFSLDTTRLSFTSHLLPRIIFSTSCDACWKKQNQCKIHCVYKSKMHFHSDAQLDKLNSNYTVTVKRGSFCWGNFHENVGKTFRVGVFFMILHLFTLGRHIWVLFSCGGGGVFIKKAILRKKHKNYPKANISMLTVFGKNIYDNPFLARLHFSAEELLLYPRRLHRRLRPHAKC